MPRDEMLDVRLELHYRRKAWNPFDMQDDALLDLGPHLIDLARWLTASEVTSVRAHALTQEHVKFVMELERGHATVICSCNSPYRERMQVRASDGRAVRTFWRGGIVAGIIGKLLPQRENPLVNSLVGQLEAFRCAVRGVPYQALSGIPASLPPETDLMVISPRSMGPSASRTHILPGMLQAVLSEKGVERFATKSGDSSLWRLRAAIPPDLRAWVARILPDQWAMQLTARLEMRGVDWTKTRAFMVPSGGYLSGRERDGIVDPKEA